MGAPHDDAWRRETAGALVHSFLAGRTLPKHLGDMPDRMLVDRLSRADAKELLSLLQEIYGVEWWNKEEFQRAFVDGALASWRPGTLVQQRPTGLRIVSTTCPIASSVEQDPRLCEACRALQRHAAFLALIGQVEDVSFERVMSRGESACEVGVTFRSEKKGI